MRGVLLLFALCCCGMPARARMTDQGRDSSGGSCPVWSDARLLLRDAGAYFTAPLHFGREEWIAAGAALAGTLVLTRIDDGTRSLALRNHSSAGSALSSFGNHYGRVQYALLGSGGAYMTGFLISNGELRETGLMLFESIAFAGLTTTVIKSLAGRSRPFQEEGPYDFRGVRFDEDHLSFPSGHSTVGFAVSSLLASRIRNSVATILLYSAATVTALSRIYDDEHWLSDVFFGAVVGTASGLAVTCLHDDPSDHRGYSLRVMPVPGGMGIAVMF